MRYSAAQFTRRTIYHSPQTPGYTCWVGAWTMPDRSFMVTFKQATGPLEDRPRLSQELLDRLGRIAPILRKDPQRDFTGLRLANVYLRSTDQGATWTNVAEDPFPGPLDRAAWGGSHIALKDGAILRAVDGSQLPLVPDLPRRVYFQRSHDLGKSWGKPEIPPEPSRPVEGYLGDFGDGITRVRRLRGGRLLAIGAKVLPHPSGDFKKGITEPILLTSGNEGKSWAAHYFLPDEHRKPGAWNEWDAAERPNGDLLCVVRRFDPQHPSRQVRWQGLLRRKEQTWELEKYGPSTLAHSGHPELLVTREGVILHIATTGTHWTEDAGSTWHPVHLQPGETPYKSRYYPRSF
jgi:hypothetical protein